jgi:hypothetical protein
MTIGKMTANGVRLAAETRDARPSRDLIVEGELPSRL